MWWNNANVYQIYTLGFCGAPKFNDHNVTNRIEKVNDWITHIKKCGFDTVLFNPVFESISHGYDTSDYYNIDARLGTNEDFKEVCKKLKDNNIRIILDGVFNHAGREFKPFLDVLEKRENSIYKDWFFIDFHNNNQYNDNLSYQNWEGVDSLVKLNLRNEDLKQYIFNAIKMWYEQFNIDGLRLDVAYCLDKDFIKALRQFTKGLNNEFFLLGELLHGDYNQFVNDDMLDSCTNYECYKGIYSSLNSNNLFEISYSLNRQFGNDNWCIYRGKHLLSFVDNHDVTRVSSILTNKDNLQLAFVLSFMMPSIPCVYYGSEWGAEGVKNEDDSSLRPSFDNPIENDLTNLISKFAKIQSNEPAINSGSYTNVLERNEQLVFKREIDNDVIYVMINCSNNTETLPIVIEGEFINLINSEKETINNPTIDGHSFKILKRSN